MSFKKDKYVIIKEAISEDLAKFCYDYFMMKKKVARTMFDTNIFHSLLNTLVYGMINKFQKHIHIILTL
jgi:hypothetical protein